jgi:arylsulfatase A-like enzyme
LPCAGCIDLLGAALVESTQKAYSLPMTTRTPGRSWILLLCGGLVLLSCGASTTAPEPERPNVVVLFIDSLRLDRVGMGISPALDDLASTNVRFSHARTHAIWTLPAWLGVLSGQGPHRGMFASQPPEALAERFLPRILKIHGYHVAYTWGDTLLEPHPAQESWFGTGATSFSSIQDATERLADLPQPFFLSILDKDLHRYGDGDLDRLMATEREAGSEEEARARVIEAYDQNLRDYDSHLERFLSALSATGLRERTVLIVGSLHGQELFDHSFLGHGTVHYDTILRVPLIISMPDDRPMAEIDMPVQLFDIAPTVLDAAGIPVHGAMKGISLLPWVEDPKTRPVERRHLSVNARFSASIIDWPHKLVLHRWDCPEASQQVYGLLQRPTCRLLFDLDQDPGEKRDVWAEQAETGLQLQAALFTQIESAGSVAPPKDPALMKVLKDRGYWRPAYGEPGPEKSGADQ